MCSVNIGYKLIPTFAVIAKTRCYTARYYAVTKLLNRRRNRNDVYLFILRAPWWRGLQENIAFPVSASHLSSFVSFRRQLHPQIL